MIREVVGEKISGEVSDYVITRDHVIPFVGYDRGRGQTRALAEKLLKVRGPTLLNKVNFYCKNCNSMERP